MESPETYIILCFYGLGGYPLLYLANYVVNYQIEAFCQPTFALVASVVHVAVGALGLATLHGEGSTKLKGVLENLQTMRKDKYGEDAKEVLKSYEDTAAPLLSGSEWLASTISKSVETALDYAPDLELQSSELPPLRGKPKTELRRNALPQDDGLSNLLPFSIHARH
ncbi:hypothetical protein CYMTET_52185 [Cymbomonas tetramitiformis]|uniref:Uncharacterized protein n=1 Tax=Cymbomonas tetramitiformis TaxID=36881 RepID=A0AAE0BLD3_9CHLO|nr:hypothetical protein CYMTET_52185 [Cymbomonas tetramitiformis]